MIINIIIILSFIFSLPLLTSNIASAISLNMIDTHGMIYKATSELKVPVQGFGKYGVHNLFDNDVRTAWAEGVDGSGIKESISFVFKKKLKKIEVVNGYAKSSETFIKNNRIRKIRVSIYEVEMPKAGKVTEQFIPVKFKTMIIMFSKILKDTKEPQGIKLPKKWNEYLISKDTYGIKFEILSVYKGTHFDDTCLSELKFSYKTDNIKKVQITNKDSEIWIQSGEENKLVRRSEEFIYQLIETDSGGNWAIIIEMPAKIEGRVETNYILLSLKQRKFISVKENIRELYGFIYKNEKVFLQAYDSKTDSIIALDLSRLE